MNQSHGSSTSRNACSGFCWSVSGLRKTPDHGSVRFAKTPSTIDQSRCDTIDYVASCCTNGVPSESTTSSSTPESSSEYGTPPQSPEQQPLPQHPTPHVTLPIPDSASFLQFNCNGLRDLAKKVSPSEDKPTNEAGVEGNTTPEDGKTASAAAPSTESTPVDPKEAKPSSRATMKRGRSTEEPHPEAKKPSTGKLPPPPTAFSAPVSGKKTVARPVETASVDPKSAKANSATTNPQPSSQNSRKRKYSQNLYPDNLRVAVIDRAEPAKSAKVGGFSLRTV
uniref:Uncharacterized protein n=1 Tax=Musca domestica TaxID=7370 RepID=A0A1I8NK10_MUSDO